MMPWPQLRDLWEKRRADAMSVRGRRQWRGNRNEAMDEDDLARRQRGQLASILSVEDAAIAAATAGAGGSQFIENDRSGLFVQIGCIYGRDRTAGTDGLLQLAGGDVRPYYLAQTSAEYGSTFEAMTQGHGYAELHEDHEASVLTKVGMELWLVDGKVSTVRPAASPRWLLGTLTSTQLGYMIEDPASPEDEIVFAPPAKDGLAHTFGFPVGSGYVPGTTPPSVPSGIFYDRLLKMDIIIPERSL